MKKSATISTKTTAEAPNRIRLSLPVTPWSIPVRTSAGASSCSTASRPTSANPISMTRRTGRTRLRSPNCGIGGVRERVGDVGLVGRRRQRLDLGQQLGRGRHGRDHVGAAVRRRRGGQPAGRRLPRRRRRRRRRRSTPSARRHHGATGASPSRGRRPGAPAPARRPRCPRRRRPGPTAAGGTAGSAPRARPGCRRRRPGRDRARRCGRPAPGSSGGARSAGWCGPAVTARSVALISASTRGSTAEVASSSTSTRGSGSSARASAMRWRWPPDRVSPRSPTTVS